MQDSFWPQWGPRKNLHISGGSQSLVWVLLQILFHRFHWSLSHNWTNSGNFLPYPLHPPRAHFFHCIPPLPGQWKWKGFFHSGPWGVKGNRGAGHVTSRVRVIWTPGLPAMPTPMSLLWCDLFPFVSSSPGEENRNHHLSTGAPWRQKTFYSLQSLTYISCLITSATLF